MVQEVWVVEVGRLRSVIDCKAAALLRESLCRQHGIEKRTITCHLRGTDAGQVFLEQNLMDLNLLLFRKSFNDENTIPRFYRLIISLLSTWKIASTDSWRAGCFVENNGFNSVEKFSSL
jgi:hypothetical protein